MNTPNNNFDCSDKYIDGEHFDDCPNKEPVDWEEDFDKKFNKDGVRAVVFIDQNGDATTQSPAQYDLKNFITNLLKEHDTKLIEAVEGKETFSHPMDGNQGWNEYNGSWDDFNESVGYNNALQDAVNIIKGV